MKMEALRSMYRDQLTETPKKQQQYNKKGHHSHLGWGFVTNQFEHKPKPFRTYATLFEVANEYTYFTPNTFYRNDQRQTDSLRWLNAMVIDVDVKGENSRTTYADLCDRLDCSGLPHPTLIVQTPSGGFHVYWYFQTPKRAFPQVTAHYVRLQTSIAKSIKGDLQATGAERWFRIPTPENVVSYTGNRVSFDEICDWYTIQQESNDGIEYSTGIYIKGSLLQHPAIQSLFKGVPEGQRDNTCYTLALACKADGKPVVETEKILLEWNQRNDPAMSTFQVKQKVRSAFKKGSPNGPAARWIRLLSGMPFTYQKWEEAKPREERTYSHQNEWEKDFLRALKKAGGVLSGSQKQIAAAIYSSANDRKSMPLSTLKKIIKRFTDIGIIYKEVDGTGRGAVTRVILNKENKVQSFYLRCKTVKSKKNRFNSYTFLDLVVGGLSSGLLGVDTAP